MQSHAPRERVSWNERTQSGKAIARRHAPRERVSWNTLVCDAHFAHTVTLHVSVWVEMQKKHLKMQKRTSRSTWACELKFSRWLLRSFFPLSRSTWACELKCKLIIYSAHKPLVTLHVSVWVEIISDAFPVTDVYIVTLHVSVWVEMKIKYFLSEPAKVTLHVSVWVEIDSFSVNFELSKSRYTWACELKYLPPKW